MSLLLQVVLIKPAYSDEPASTEQKVLHRTFKIPYTEKDGEILVIKTSIEESMWKGLTNLIEITRVACESLLNDTEILHEIRDYDLIVYESLGLCATLVAELLDIPMWSLFQILRAILTVLCTGCQCLHHTFLHVCYRFPVKCHLQNV